MGSILRVDTMSPEKVMHILLVLRILTPPTPCVFVAGDWPGSLILLLALNLPIQGAFFPTKSHKYFKPSKYQVTSWCSVADFHGLGEETCSIFLSSGRVTFLQRVLGTFSCSQCVIVLIDVTRQGAS